MSVLLRFHLLTFIDIIEASSCFILFLFLRNSFFQIVLNLNSIFIYLFLYLFTFMDFFVLFKRLLAFHNLFAYRLII